MKTVAALLLLFVTPLAIADKYVAGHVRSDGTYVQPHFKSEANGSRADNYSSHGNTNPYTGQKGYERNEYSNPPAYNQPRDSRSGSHTDSQRGYR